MILSPNQNKLRRYCAEDKLYDLSKRLNGMMKMRMGETMINRTRGIDNYSREPNPTVGGDLRSFSFPSVMTYHADICPR